MKRVIVIGGGIGGLCTAIALRQAGFEPVVYEKTGAFDVAGAGLTLWANAIRVLRALGIDDSELEGSRIQNGAIRSAEGETLTRLPSGEIERILGAPTIAIHRAALHEVLLSKLPKESIFLNAACTRFEQDEAGVTVCFADGHVDRADLLVGADGIHSTIRQKLFPEVRLRYAGYAAWRGVVSLDAGIKVNETSESWGRGLRFGIVPIGGRQIYWFAAGNQPKGIRTSPEERKSLMLEHFSKWHAPIAQILEATPAESILENDVYDFQPMSRWSQGRVTLLGDAAHATTPNMGQGACQAIESSLELARSLADCADVGMALQRYEAERHERTAWITNNSWMMGKVGQWENPVACAARTLVMRLTPASVMLKQLEGATGIRRTG